ncbi:MAG TPA: hypothetical protein VF352_00230 [Anaerolineales bacterium]
MTLPPNQRMFHGGIRSTALADQLSARFSDRQHRVGTQVQGETALVQIGSKYGTPVTVHIADTEIGSTGWQIPVNCSSAPPPAHSPYWRSYWT